MKKVSYLLAVFFAVFFFNGFSQVVNYVEAPLFDNSTSTGRGPNGTSSHVYMRACGLVKATELTNIAVSSTITSFGYTVNQGAAGNAPVGNYTLYLQNTSDATYTKGTSFSSAIVGMTQVYANTMTIPISATSTSIIVTLSTPFVYTGGGIYVAYDWYCAGPYSSSAVVYRCNSGGLSPGLASTASAAGPAPDALGTTAFRPCFLFGVSNTYTNEIAVTGMEAPGRLSGLLGTSHSVKAFVRNNSNIAKTNIPVSLNVNGANTFTDLQTIPSLAAGATTLITFAPSAPALSGLNTLSVSVPSDELNTNNSSTYSQSITCNEWALNPAAVNYTMGAVGFNTGSGIIACTYTNPSAATLTGLRGSISTNTPSIGNGTWGVLLSSTGAVIATTNTVTITGGNLGSLQTYTFATPPNLTVGTAYYIGFAQPTGTVGYFPMGTYTTAYVPYLNYITTTTVGGTPAPLTSNLGYFGMEAIFAPTLAVSLNSPTVVCGSTAVLSATTIGSYTWAAGPANTNYSVVPNANSIYTVNASTSYGCANSATAMVTVNPLTVTAMSSTTTVCAGSSVSISSGGASTYTWSAGPNPNAASFTDTPTTSITYSVQGGNAAGCTGSASVAVNVNPSPTVSAFASNNTTMCVGQTNTLNATGATTYSWNTGPLSASIVVTPTVAGLFSYTVTGIGANSCSDTGVVSLQVSPCTTISEENVTANNIKVFPNPFNTQLSLVFENEAEGKTEIMITNILGEIILQERATGVNHSLNLENLESGVYFVTVLQNEKKASCVKVFKQ